MKIRNVLLGAGLGVFAAIGIANNYKGFNDAKKQPLDQYIEEVTGKVDTMKTATKEMKTIPADTVMSIMNKGFHGLK